MWGSFVSGITYGTSFILLRVALQFSQHHLLKRQWFPHWVLLSNVRGGFTLGSWFCPLVYVSASHPVLICAIALDYSLKTGSGTPSALFFFLKITLAIWSLFWFHTNLELFSIPVKKKRKKKKKPLKVWQMALACVDMLMILILLKPGKWATPLCAVLRCTHRA